MADSSANEQASAPGAFARLGGEDVFKGAFPAYWRELVAFVRTKVGAGPPEPEDVAQQALSNFAALADPGAVENPRAFLHRSALNIVASHFRHSAVARRHAEAETAAADSAPPRDESTPERVLLGREQLQAVERAIRAMEPRRRRYLLLNRLDGLSYAEIARREGVSESAVRKQVAAAVKLCGLAVADADEEGEAS